MTKDNAIRTIRESLENYLDNCKSEDALSFALNFDKGSRHGGITGYRNVAMGFYAGYIAALDTLAVEPSAEYHVFRGPATEAERLANIARLADEPKEAQP